MLSKQTLLLILLRKMTSDIDCRVDVVSECEQHNYTIQHGAYTHTVPVDAMQLATMTPQQIELLAEEISLRWHEADKRLIERLKSETLQ